MEKDRIYFPESRFLELAVANESYSKFYQSTSVKKIKVKFNKKDIFLSRREFDVLSLIVKGKSMKEVADELNLSPRTIESHVHNAKNKSDMFTVGQLMDSFEQSLF